MTRMGGQWPGRAFQGGGHNALPAEPSLPSGAELQSTYAGGIDSQGDRDVLVSPLLTLFPQFESRAVYASEIAVPAGVTIAAGQAGWYMLRSFRIPRDLPECAYIGMEATLLPTDVDGVAAPSTGPAAAWGDVTGSKAQIVLAFNTGLQLQSWTSRVAYLPGLDTAAPNLLNVAGAPEYLASTQFPPGKLSATTPTKLYAASRFLPAAARVIGGDTLDVCLVVNRAQVNAASIAEASFVGNIDLRLHFLPISGAKTYRKTSGGGT